VESIEYPNFFLIPYYSNYLISRDGKLLKVSDNIIIQPSLALNGYYTFRMKHDRGGTQNRLRHRILATAFLPYPKDYGLVDNLQVNHRDGVKGFDQIENLEWVTFLENVHHAIDNGLLDSTLTNQPVEIRDIRSKEIFIFQSIKELARLLKTSFNLIRKRISTNGYKSFDGYQFRKLSPDVPWPEITEDEGNYLVEFPNGVNINCGCEEAARYAGVTRTSLLRILRQGGRFGTTANKITRLKMKSLDFSNKSMKNPLIAGNS